MKDVRRDDWHRKLDEYLVKVFTEVSQSPKENVDRYVKVWFKKRRGDMININIDANMGEWSFDVALEEE